MAQNSPTTTTIFMSDELEGIKEDEDINAKERRRIKREQAKAQLKEKEELAKSLGALPPNERVSVFGAKFPESKETHWTHYAGAGWVHASEHLVFTKTYMMCSVGKTWHNIGLMVRIMPDEIYMFNETARKTYHECPYSGAWCRKEDAFEAYISHDKKGFVYKAYQADFQVCEHSKRLHQRSQMVGVRGHDTIKRIFRGYVDGKTFAKCPDCERIYPAAQVFRRPDLANRLTCNGCYDGMLSQNLILPHNHAIYPAAMHTPRTIKKMTGGEKKKDENGFSYYTGKRTCATVSAPSIRLFGVEAETEIWRKGAERDSLNRYRLAKMLLDTLGSDFIIIKEDGTLTTNEHYSKRTGFAGFEVVTCPADLEAHRSRWLALLDPRFQDSKGNHYFRAWDEYDTCGFHVHVSRDSLTHFQIGRILTFINHKNNAKFIHRVAGRGSDRFCKYIPKEPEDKTHPASDVFYPHEKVVNTDETGDRNRSRRVAVNLSNKHTIEFRIFRGTMHPRHILRNIEFCDAVCDFCNPGDRSIKDLEDYRKFIAYVDSNRKSWPLLAEWMANQKVIAIKKMDEAKADKGKLTIKPDQSVEVERKPGKPEKSISDYTNGISKLINHQEVVSSSSFVVSALEPSLAAQWKSIADNSIPIFKPSKISQIVAKQDPLEADDFDSSPL